MQTLSQLNKNLETRKADLKALQEKYKIRETVRGEGDQPQQAAEGASAAASGSSGVLV